MSDHESTDRPSKRRRRESYSISPPRKAYRDGHRRPQESRNESSLTTERKRSRSLDRYKPRSDSRSRERYDSSHHSSGRRRSRSPDRPSDRERRPRRPSRDRSPSPQHSDRRRYRLKERERSRDRDNGYGSDGRQQRHQRHNHRDSGTRRHRDRTPSPPPSSRPYERSKVPLLSQNEAFSSTSAATGDKASTAVAAVPEKQKPNFGRTGILAAASNTVHTGPGPNQTIVLKYHEPPEARKPPARDQWRLYVFGSDDNNKNNNNDEILETIELSEQSCWLIGREVAVADIALAHDTCSKQHAALQFRYLERRTEFGDRVGRVRPYVIDLESAHGTRLNGDPVPPAKYVELRDKDILKFGRSGTEYVIQLPPALPAPPPTI